MIKFFTLNSFFLISLCISACKGNVSKSVVSVYADSLANRVAFLSDSKKETFSETIQVIFPELDTFPYSRDAHACSIRYTHQGAEINEAYRCTITENESDEFSYPNFKIEREHQSCEGAPNDILGKRDVVHIATHKEENESFQRPVALAYVHQLYQRLGAHVPAAQLVAVKYNDSKLVRPAVVIEDTTDTAKQLGSSGASLIRLPEDNNAPEEFNLVAGSARLLDQSRFWLHLLATSVDGSSDRSHRYFESTSGNGPRNVEWVRLMQSNTQNYIPIAFNFDSSGIYTEFSETIRDMAQLEGYIGHPLWDQLLHPRNGLVRFLIGGLHRIRRYQQSLQPGCQATSSCDNDIKNAYQLLRAHVQSELDFLKSAPAEEWTTPLVDDKILLNEVVRDRAIEFLDAFLDVMDKNHFVFPVVVSSVQALSAPGASTVSCPLSKGDLAAKVNEFGDWLSIQTDNPACKGKEAWLERSFVSQ